MADAEFMIHHDGIGEAQSLEAFGQMKPIVELREAFGKGQTDCVEVRARRGGNRRTQAEQRMIKCV